MADRGDTHYFTPSLNRWFLVSSVFLLGTVVWTVIDDWAAEWKTYQRDFRQLELVKAEEALEDLELRGAMQSEAQLTAAVEAARQRMSEREVELSQAKTEAYERKEALAAINDQLKSAKSKLGWDKYIGEEEILHDENMGVAEAQAELAEIQLEANQLGLQVEDATAEYDAAEGRVTELSREFAEAEKAWAAGTRDLTRVRDKIEMLDPASLVTTAANVVRDFPGLDFIGPNLKITKQVPANLTFELNFTKKQRIDMCTTCHMGTDRTGFEDAQQPFATHPRLDLFLTSKSAHPLKDIGCTICHRGSGESLSFQHADHRPSDEAEGEAWYDEYHWHKQHHWDYPMLQSGDIEASCIQCHTTSMELIADDAPKVTEGYRLVEQYGCYSCHKIEWFPTSRRPGPSLKNLAAKLTPDFVDSWISDPKAFRPTTWMPQIFHLENFAADEVVVTSEYGAGADILGQPWNETAVAAITSYLFQNHPKQDLPPIPVEGDAERGREVFRLTGCLACHNIAPYPGEEAPFSDPAFEPGEHDEFGPNLRGVATKVDATWLYHWIKDPKSYWEGTRMPNLRLSEQDAADITAYMMSDPDNYFRELPDGWDPQPSNMDLAILREQARWFYDKDGRRELERRFAGENEMFRWDRPEDLAAAVGEAFVRNQGCFSCHEIKGLEDAQPIGTELTNWGSKTVDKLDFGMHYRKKVAGLPLLEHEYREGWLARKLHRPRSYDIDKIKNPKEKLKMPYFGFSDEEVEALSTFVLGLVDDEVSAARMLPTPAQAQMDRGMRVVRQRNCMACHEVDPAQVTFMHEGQEMTVEAEISPLEYDVLPPKMDSLEGLREYIAGWEEDNDEELEDVVLRLQGVSPEFGAPGDKVIVSPDDLVALTPARGGDFVRMITDYYTYGVPLLDPEEPEEGAYPWTFGYDEDSGDNQVEDVDGVTRTYWNEELDKLRSTFAPPVLWNEGHKVQREWFYSFLKDPVGLREQLRVRMPSFRFEPGEAEAVADYFGEKARTEWYSRYAKSMRLTLGREASTPFEAGATSWPPMARYVWPLSLYTTKGGGGALSIEDVATGAGLDPGLVAGIENGVSADIASSFDKLFDWGTAQGFAMTGPVSSSYERIERRAPSHLAAREDFIRVGHDVAADAVNCFQCHPQGGQLPETPIAWAPDLSHTRERLREEWVREWLWKPAAIYPFTPMPANFAADEPQYQDVYPNSSNVEQIEAVLDWLFNLDHPASISD